MISKPAKHTKYSFQDQQAVGLVSAWIAGTNRAMPDLKANDKWPNIDGYVELTDAQGYPVGSVKVQIKKLSKENAKKCKHTFKDNKFLSYCRETTDWIPIIFIGVDLDNEIAYWVHIDEALLASLGEKKTISLNSSDFIKKGDLGFIAEWLKIHDLYSSKSTKFEEYKKSYAILADVVTPALGVSRDYFDNIHVFLDSLNDALEKDFVRVKKVFYPNTWKIGLAYYEYSKTELAYTLYPIAHDKNDVQIKEIDKYIHDKIQSQGLGFTGHFRDNPIAIDPIKYSYTLLKSKLDEVIQGKILSHSGSEFLATEFIFAFVDKFHIQLGLEDKDEYSLSEIAFAYNVYMPIWIEESFNLMVSTDRNNIRERIRRKPLDPDTMISEIMPSERTVISQKIKSRIEKNELETDKYVIEHNTLPFRIFIEFFKFLEATNKKEISRVYKKRDFERLTKLNSNHLYDVFSEEDILYNIQKFLQNIQESFDLLVKNNFPRLENSIKLWHGANKVLIHLDIKDSYLGAGGPGIDMIFLRSGSREAASVEMIKDDLEWEEIKGKTSFEKIRDNQEINYKGKTYKINTPTFSSSSVLDFIYSETPMLNYLYEYLGDEFKQYFKSRVYERSH